MRRTREDGVSLPLRSWPWHCSLSGEHAGALGVCRPQCAPTQSVWGQEPDAGCSRVPIKMQTHPVALLPQALLQPPRHRGLACFFWSRGTCQLTVPEESCPDPH